MGSHGGSAGPTLQQQQLQTQQGVTAAELNLETNEQRKTIDNAMLGTRVFRGSALSRAVRGNAPGGRETPPGPSRTQVRNGRVVPVVRTAVNLLDQRNQTAAAGNANAASIAGGGGENAVTGGTGGTGRAGGSIRA